MSPQSPLTPSFQHSTLPKHCDLYFNENIMKFLDRFSRKKQTKPSFDSFFHDTPPKEQERILKEVMRKAGEDQRQVIEQYNRLHPKAT
jgi:hypothetical protein